MPPTAEKKELCNTGGACPFGGYWGRLMLVLGLAALLAGAFPQVDLAVSSWFYDPRSGFVRSEMLDLIRHTLPWLIVFCVVYPAVLAWRGLVSWRAPVFVALTYALGPGLIVNGILKENYGRARPNQIEAFGGHAHFTGALTLSDQCAHNCSFTAGDPSVGFALIAFALLWPKARLPLSVLALLAGIGFGVIRIAQGGHFLSDVLFSALVSVGSALIAYHFCFNSPCLERLTCRFRRKSA